MAISIDSELGDNPPRRQAPRYAASASISIPRAEGEISGRCLNVSSSGLCAEVNGPIAPGTTVTLAITLEFDQGDVSEALPLPARNVWCTQIGDAQYQLGFQFTALDPQQSNFLKLFLRYLQS
ncbi:MAG: PilZ domain-containing protein [Kofleriaceae bacterium]|nr:PilZ domain-containing protein [Kofleriaceae bacterium]